MHKPAVYLAMCVLMLFAAFPLQAAAEDSGEMKYRTYITTRADEREYDIEALSPARRSLLMGTDVVAAGTVVSIALEDNEWVADVNVEATYYGDRRLVGRTIQIEQDYELEVGERYVLLLIEMGRHYLLINPYEGAYRILGDGMLERREQNEIELSFAALEEFERTAPRRFMSVKPEDAYWIWSTFESSEVEAFESVLGDVLLRDVKLPGREESYRLDFRIDGVKSKYSLWIDPSRTGNVIVLGPDRQRYEIRRRSSRKLEAMLDAVAAEQMAKDSRYSEEDGAGA